MKYEEAYKIVGRGLFVVGQPRTVDVRKFIEQLMRRDFHPNEFLGPIGLHAPNTKMTDEPGWIQVTKTNVKGDIVIGMNEDGLNDLVIDLFKSKVAALAHVQIERIPKAPIKEVAVKYVTLDLKHVLSANVETTKSVA